MKPLRVGRCNLEKCGVWLIVTASQQVFKLSYFSSSHSEAAEDLGVDVRESPVLLDGTIMQETETYNSRILYIPQICVNNILPNHEQAITKQMQVFFSLL